MLFAMISIMLVMGESYATELKSVVPSPPGIWIRIDISFHRQKSNCKTGFGFCIDFTVGGDRPNFTSDQNLCPVKGQLNDKNQLIIEVTAEALANYEFGSTLPYFKDKTSIRIEEPYTLSAATCRALGAAMPVTIKAGSYPVSFANGIYTIVIQL